MVAALYDSNGGYTAGTVKRNAAWVAAPFSGLLSQVTAYQLVNSRADLEKIANDLGGVYALGKDVDLSGTGDFNGIGGAANAVFTGQFDGMGHAIRNMTFYNESDSQSYIALFSSIGKSGVVRNLEVLDANLNVWAESEVAIVAGLNQGLISNTYTSGTAAKSNYGRAGGLVVQNDGVIERSSSSADVDANDLSGGIAATNTGLILQSFATGSAGGGTRANAGGLVGDNQGTITQSYAANYVGAVLLGGITCYNSGSISESFVSSNLDGNVVGGIFPQFKGGIAYSNNGAIANDVFWDVQKTAADIGTFMGTAVAVANGLTTAQMSVKSSFGPTWDFGPTGVWVMPVGGTHPILRWQIEAH